MTFTVKLWPAARVKGGVGPLKEKPLPAAWSPVMVSATELVLVTTTGTVELLPVATEPNDTIDGLPVALSRVAPVPATPSIRVELEALLEKVISVSPVQPVAAGVKVTFRLMLCPADRTNGRLKLDGVKSELATAILETVTLVCPLFARVTIKVSF